jgi:hypothetical protein
MSLFQPTMKSFSLLITKRALLAFAFVSAVEFSGVRADDGFYQKFGLDLANAGRTHQWAIFTYGSGTSGSPFTAIDVSSPTAVSGFQVDGDIALAGAYSKLSVSGFGSVSGDRYERRTSTESRTGNGVIGGSRFSSSSLDSTLVNAIAALKNVSNNAAALTATSGSPANITLNGGNMTFSNNPFSGKYVMKLGNFTLNNNSTLTLNGAAGSAFVINVSNNFSLNNGSKIVLSGGLTFSDVLFNIRGPSGTFSIGGGSLFNGTLLAYNSTSSAQRTLTISGANTLVNGQVIANKVVVSGGGKVKKPKKVSKEDDDDDGGRH